MCFWCSSILKNLFGAQHKNVLRKKKKEWKKLTWREISKNWQILGYILTTAVYNIYLHPLNAYPGPFLARSTLVSQARKMITFTGM